MSPFLAVILVSLCLGVFCGTLALLWIATAPLDETPTPKRRRQSLELRQYGTPTNSLKFRRHRRQTTREVTMR